MVDNKHNYLRPDAWLTTNTTYALMHGWRQTVRRGRPARRTESWHRRTAPASQT